MQLIFKDKINLGKTLLVFAIVFGSVTSVLADCLEKYEKIVSVELSEKVEKDEKDLSKTFGFAKRSSVFPLLCGSACFKAAVQSPFPINLLPLGGTVIAPIVVAPFSTVATLGAIGLVAPVQAIKKEIDVGHDRANKGYMKAFTLLTEVKKNKSNYFRGYQLNRFLKHSTVRKEYNPDYGVIDDLNDANEAQFFCQNDKLMSYKEILESIKNGEMNKFLKGH